MISNGKIAADYINYVWLPYFPVGLRGEGRLCFEELDKIRSVSELQLISNLGSGVIGITKQVFSFQDQPFPDDGLCMASYAFLADRFKLLGRQVE